MTISLLPTPPSRQDPANFALRADAFLGQLPLFGEEANALAVDVNNKQVIASAAATTATIKASEANTSATNAATSASNAATSATNAANSATSASNSATIATTKASEALTSANNAATSATNASNSETKASEWADSATEVEPGRFSAKYWADQAASAVGVIDDSTPSTVTAYSSQKVEDDFARNDENLSGLTNVSTARANLGLGTAALFDATNLLNRANHTGTQAISTIDGLQTALDSKLGSAGTQAKTINNLGNVATVGSQTVNVDLTASDFHIMSMETADATGTLTLNFTNIPDTTNKYISWYVRIRRGGRKPLAFTQVVNWSGGVSPSLGNSTSSYDVIWFYKIGTDNIRAAVIDVI